MWEKIKHKAGVVLLVLLWAGFGYAGQIELSRGDMALTPAEMAWLEKNPVISAGGPLAFPPFHFFDDQGNLKGISADYLFSIMKALGLEVIVQKNLPWTEVLEKARSGQIDVIACAAKTVERETYLSFTMPYLSFPLVILTRKDAPFIGGIQDLHGKTLAVIEKNATIDRLKKGGIAFVPY